MLNGEVNPEKVYIRAVMGDFDGGGDEDIVVRRNPNKGATLYENTDFNPPFRPNARSNVTFYRKGNSIVMKTDKRNIVLYNN